MSTIADSINKLTEQYGGKPSGGGSISDSMEALLKAKQDMDPNDDTWRGDVDDAISELQSDVSELQEDVSDLQESVAGKVPLPGSSPQGTSGQMLKSNGDGTTTWQDNPSAQEIVAAVEGWMDTNISGGSGTVVVDSTLLVEGAAADSKTVGEELSELNSAITNETNEYIEKISQNTKNILDVFSLLKARPNITYKDGVYSGPANAWNIANTPIMTINDSTSIRYTLSFEAKVEGPTTTGSSLYFKFNVSSGNYEQIGVPNNTSDWTSFSVTSKAYAVVSNLTTLISSGVNNTIYVRKLQLEVGTSATAYEYPLTAYDKKAEGRLIALENLGLSNSYPTIKSMAYDSYVNFMTENPYTIDNKRIAKSNGAEGDNTSYIATDYLFVKAGATVYYKLYSSNGNISCLYLYDMTKTAVSSIVNGGVSDYTTGSYTAVSDCYIRSCYDKAWRSCYLKFTQTGNVINRLNDAQDTLPDYWETYLSGKDSDINSFIASVGDHGDYFLLFTDYHTKSNTGYTPKIVKRLCKRYPIDKVVNCGDIINTEDTVAIAESELDTFFEQFSGVNLFNVFGNHDSNPYQSGQELTESQYYNFLFKKNEQRLNLTPTKGGYYYFDNPLQKIRYIVLNTHGNGFETDDKSTQLPWLANAMNTVESGWYICIIMHMGFEWYNSGTTVSLFAAGITVKTMADAYQNRSSGTVMTDFSFDFTNATGNVACVISGHAHINTYVTSDAGYSIIGFDRDGLNYPPPPGDNTRTAGNATEQSLAIVAIDTTAKKVKCLGIGAGADREFEFN